MIIAHKTLREYTFGYSGLNTKAMGQINKDVLIKYLKAVKAHLVKITPEVEKADAEYRDKVAKAKAEIENWEKSYADKVLASLASVIDKGDRSAVYVPNLIELYSKRPFYEQNEPLPQLIEPKSIVITPKSHPKLKKILDSAPSAETARLASEDFTEWSPARNRYYEDGTWLDSKVFAEWLEQIDELIAQLEARATPKINVAQVIEVQKMVETVLGRYKATNKKKRPSVKM